MLQCHLTKTVLTYRMIYLVFMIGPSDGSPSKCEALNITNKRSPIPFTYHVGSAPVTWCNKVKYLGVVITSNLK